MAYTRDGSFEISDQRVLVTQEGYTLVPGIKIPEDATAVTISQTGVVSCTRGSAANGESVEIGRIELARFANPGGLLADGQNLYTATSASGDAVLGFPQDDGMGRLAQGHLESSNVEIVQEMVEMITAMRAYEINSKAIKNSEQMLEIANNLVR